MPVTTLSMFPIPRAKIGSSIGHNTEDLSDRGLDDVTFTDDLQNGDGVSMNGGGGGGSTIPNWMSLLERRDIQENLNAFGMALGRKNLPGNSSINLSPFSAKSSTSGSVINPVYDPTPFFTLPHSIESFSIDGDKRRYSYNNHRTRNTCLLVLLLVGLLLALAAISTGTLYTVVDNAPDQSSRVNGSEIEVDTTHNPTTVEVSTSSSPTTTTTAPPPTTATTTPPTTTTTTTTSLKTTIMSKVSSTPPTTPTTTSTTTTTTIPSTQQPSSTILSPSTTTPLPTTTTTRIPTTTTTATTAAITTTPTTTTTARPETTTEQTSPPPKTTTTTTTTIPTTTTASTTTLSTTTTTTATSTRRSTTVLSTTQSTTALPTTPTTTVLSTTQSTTALPTTPTTTTTTPIATTVVPSTPKMPTTTTTTLETTTPMTTTAIPETTTTVMVTDSTTENTTTTPPPIYIVTNVSNAYLYSPTNITCLWTKNETGGPVLLKGVDEDLGYENGIAAFTESGQHGSFFPGLFITTVSNTSDGQLLMTTTIVNTSCLDASLSYQCTLLNDPYQKHLVPMELIVLPDVSMTSSPKYVIENEIFQVTCQGLTTPSVGEVTVVSKKRSDVTYKALASNSESRNNLTVESCSVLQEVTFDIKMDAIQNASMIRCETTDPIGKSEDYTVLMILESACSNTDEGGHVAHPYERTLYIRCGIDPVIEVMTCDPGYIFNLEEGRCTDPFAAVVTFEPRNFTESGPLFLNCLVAKGNYSNITLLRLTDDVEEVLVVYHVDGTNDVTSSRHGRVQRSTDVNTTVLTAEVPIGLCGDVGEYSCRHDNGKYSTGQIDIEIKARPVAIAVQEDVIETQPIVISCDGVVDTRGGIELLYSNAVTGGEYREVESTQFGAVDAVLSSDRCKSSRNRQFIGAASSSMNGTLYKCSTSSPIANSSSIPVLVVTESACLGKTDGSLQSHPYSNHKYLVCGLFLEVRECQDSQVWSLDLTRCVDSDAAAVTFIDATAHEGDSLDLVCAVSEGSFDLIGLSRLEGGGKQPISSFAVNGSNDVTLSNRDVRASRRVEEGNRVMVTSLREVSCTDRGLYECTHDNGQRSKGNVTVYAKAPTDATSTLDLDGWPVAERDFTVHCLGVILDTAGDGQVVLQRADDLDRTFSDVMVNNSVVTVVSQDTCKTEVIASLTLSRLTLSEWNGTFIRCKTNLPKFESQPKQLLVVDESLCDGLVSGSLVSNPYANNSYIRCFKDNLVFESCPDDKIWRQDLTNCAETDAAIVAMIDGSLVAEIDDVINITCAVTNGSYLSVSLLHSSDGVREDEIIRYFPDGTNLVSSPQVTSTLRFMGFDDSTQFVTTLSAMTCQNGGQYICRHDNTQSASGSLEVKIPPFIKLTAESDYTPITTNFIVCDGRVDLRSSGDVKLAKRNPVTGQFVDAGIPVTSSRVLNGLDGCWERRQSTFTSTFDLSLNDTDFQCETTTPAVVSEPFRLLVIPGDICLAEGIGSSIEHPYSRYKYIICFGTLYTAQPCPGSFYFNNNLRECVDDTWATTTIQAQKSFTSQGKLTVTCLLTPGDFSTLTLYKVKDNDLEPIASMTSNWTTSVHSLHDVIANSTSSTDFERRFDVTILSASCLDLGGYMCALDNGQNRTDTVDEVTVLPSIKVTAEEDFTPITENYIICEGILDLRSGGGEIRLTRKDKSTGEYVDAGVPVEMSSVADGVDTCWEYRQTTFQQTFEMAWNDTDLRCETTVPATVTDSFHMLVVPGDVCLSEGIAARIRHPYTNRKEILCFGNLYMIMPCAGDYVYNDVTRECSDPAIPITRIEVPSSFTDLQDLRLTCLLSSGTFSTLTLLKIGQQTELVALLDSDLNTIPPSSSELKTSVDTAGAVTRFVVDKVNASCPDVALYMCLLDNGQNSTAEVGDIIVPESPIALTFGQDFISDTSYNVTCSAPVQGQKQFVLQRSNGGQTDFVDTGLSPVYSSPKDGNSKCRRQADFENVYDMTWNGTRLRCQTEANTQTSNVETMLVIPGDYCLPFPIGSQQPHPYTDTKYIFCFGDFLSINPCPGDLLWRKEFRECRDPTEAIGTTSRIVSFASSLDPFVAPTSSEAPQPTTTTTTTTTAAAATTTLKPKTPTTPMSTTKSATTTTTSTTTVVTTTLATTTEAVVIPVIAFPSANFTLGSRGDLICTITNDGWSTVIVAYLTGDGGSDLVSTFSFDGSFDLAVKPGVTVSRSLVDGGSNVTLTSTFADMRCTNEGQYVCSDDAANSQEATIGVMLPVQITVTTPPYMTSYEGSSFACTGTVKSDGRLFFSVRLVGEETYQELSVLNFATEVSDVTDCTKTVTLTIDFVFDMTYNGSSIRCESTDQSLTSDDFQMLILPSDFCDTVESGQVVEHPYSCQFYITCLILRDPIVQSCSPGLCYNPDLGFCEVKETESEADSDPFSCQGKSASSYIPVQKTCTEYNWCVNGNPIPGTCPPLTFYSSTNQPCSNVASEAFCSTEELRLEGFNV